MSDKLITIELTEREWDHVQLAVEETAVQLSKAVVNRAIDALPCSAIARSVDRFENIANKIGLRLEEESDYHHTCKPRPSQGEEFAKMEEGST